MLALELRKIPYAVEDIGVKAELVFKPLRRGVGQPGEGSEIGGVYEVFPAQLSHVDTALASFRDIPCGGEHVTAYIVELGKIVRAAGGHIADGDVKPRFYHSAYRLV